MPDVTISDLGNLTPVGTSFVPLTNGTTTGKASIASLQVDYNNLTNKPTIPSVNSLQLAKAWVNFNGTGTVGTNQTIRNQYNISSVNKLATGQFRVTFSSAMPNANYVVTAMAVQFDNTGVHTGVTACWNFTTTNFVLYTQTIWIPGKDNAYFYDSELITLAVFGT